MKEKADEKFMRQALDEARKGAGFTSPNPAVGAILVERARILARGYHRQAGADHAEVDCLRKISGPVPPGAILYVTLEPCSTRGRTAPCVDYIIERGVRRVMIGAVDPNPKHRGRAIEMLHRAGIEVSTGVLESKCTALNEAFNKWIRTRQPFVIAKCGMSLDGRLTAPPTDSQRITSVQSRHDAQELRATVDVIIVGAETIRQDNPRLTVRIRSANKQPWRVILTRSGRLPHNANVFCDSHASRTLIYRKQRLRTVLRDLGRREMTSVLLEGGGEVLSEALDQGLIDKVQIYIGAKLTSGSVLAFGGKGARLTAESFHLKSARYERFGHDVRVTGYLESPARIVLK